MDKNKKDIKQITTPIYYPNGDPHIGHAHTTVMGDVLKRCLQMAGSTVLYSTGLDEHGQKIQETIAQSGKTTEKFLDEKSDVFKNLFNRLNIDYDVFIRTTEDKHKKFVQQCLQKVYDKGLIEKQEYSGLYCVGCEQFKTLADLDEQGNCRDHAKPPVQTSEVNYAFKMEPFRQFLLDHIEANQDFVKPEQYCRDLVNMLKEPLVDLCISRPKSRVTLGIELPFDKDFVTYVWFDALLNYATVNNGELTSDCTHLMAKDILKTHGVIWPIMLRALDMNLPKHLFVHGYWTARDGTKMSKSLGNVVDPIEMLDKFGTDAIRYFLARGSSKDDSPIGEDMILGVFNAELANIIGNGFYRVLKMLDKKTNGEFPKVNSFRDCDTQFISSIATQVQNFFGSNFDLQTIARQAELVASIGRDINLYLDKTAPWKLDGEEFYSCALSCLEAARLMFELAYPIMPQTARIVFTALNTEFDPQNYKTQIRKIKSGKIGTYQPLFQRMEVQK